MLTNVLSTGLMALAAVVGTQVAGVIPYAVTLIRQHFKNRFVSDSLAILTTIAGTVVGSVVQTAASDLPNVRKPGFGSALAGDLKKAIVDDIKAFGASALSQLQTHGGLSGAAIDSLVDRLVAKAAAGLGAPALPVVPLAVSATTPLAAPLQVAT